MNPAPLVGEESKRLQTELQLFPGEPWGGRSPRALTRARSGFIFKPQGVKDERFFVDPLQLDLFAIDRIPPRKLYSGAPLLVDLYLEGK